MVGFEHRQERPQRGCLSTSTEYGADRQAERFCQPQGDVGICAGWGLPREDTRDDSVELAFIAALQHLPARQRAVLILRDVLGFTARQTAEALDTTPVAIDSALQRAHNAVDTRLPERSQQATLRSLGDRELKQVVEDFVTAWEQADVDAVVAMLAHDAVMAMPPEPTWFAGRDGIAAFLAATPLASESPRHRLLPTQANGQIAFGHYNWRDEPRAFLPHAITILTLRGTEIAEVTFFRAVKAQRRSPDSGCPRGLRPDHHLALIAGWCPCLTATANRWISILPRLCMRNNRWRKTMSIERALVIGAGSGVGQATARALAAAGTEVVGVGRERDVTDPDEVSVLLEAADPDLVVIAAGTRPHMVSIEEQSWESFARPWNVDVKIAFEVGRAALARPLRRGSTVVILSSGAGVNPNGSPLSGGYAGAKRMQMFLAAHLQRAADARELDIRFVALAPLQFLVGTRIGQAAADAYGAAAGQSGEEYIKSWPRPLDPEGVARAILSLMRAGEYPDATQLGVTAEGLQLI